MVSRRALAVVFGGYALGWRHELAGGALAIVGTIAFFVINALTVHVLPGAAALWFAVPGLLYIQAWRLQRHGESQARV